MSRLTKFLKQKCIVQPYALGVGGAPLLNDFGELQYTSSKTCKCRHEIAYKDVQDYNGQIVKSQARYFLDNSYEIKANYKIDGKIVISVATLVNGVGKCEGYEVYV